LHPGRYAAIDIGTNSSLLLVADLEPDGSLRPVCERNRITRLGEKATMARVLAPGAMSRTLAAVAEYVDEVRRTGAQCTAIVGTAVLREAQNGAEFCQMVRARCGLPVEVITGGQEAELAWRAQQDDPGLDLGSGPRAVLDIGGGSTELVHGAGEEIASRASYPLGAVRVTEQYLKHDPPAAADIDGAEQAIERILSPLEPLVGAPLLVGTGGTIANLGAVARAAGMIGAGETHGARLPHRCVAELVDLFRSLPIRFRQRVPNLEPARADVILGGAMILHQAMARLSAPEIVVSTRGIRHGCIFMMAERALSLTA
jgi:exopolyphosphatase/guanosine-5'-triphosphate,3'-diphosphate pyrophosphatase